MKCPLLGAHTWTNAEGTITMTGDCLKEECAWWNEIEERCVIFVAEYALSSLVAAIYRMLEKMPCEK